ncbi:hypothetical protein R1flu_021449 [Riccia fluitans]|uniref:Uncharacterized protein n=1 Tax=Riccia fluitans TaxID=41844 RepID=A0ABD1ZR50_9MARC
MFLHDPTLNPFLLDTCVIQLDFAPPSLSVGGFLTFGQFVRPPFPASIHRSLPPSLGTASAIVLPFLSSATVNHNNVFQHNLYLESACIMVPLSASFPAWRWSLAGSGFSGVYRKAKFAGSLETNILRALRIV